MNIYSYIISPDIADHCQKIGHVFNSLEMAVIIAISEKTIKEKHAAWREIVAYYPDMPIQDSLNFDARESLHDFLKELITWEEKCITDFYATGDDVVFCPRVDHYKECYRTVEKTFAALNDLWNGKKDGITEIEIYKKTIDAPKYCGALFNSDAEMLALYGYDFGDDCPGRLHMIFIHIPVPFEKGDLLEHDGKSYVLEDLPHWFTEKSGISYEEMLSGNADGSDMISSIYCVSNEGVLYWDHGPLYYTLKFCRMKIEGEYRLLHYVSLFMKGEIRLAELLTMQCRIMLEHQLQHNLPTRSHGCYIPEHLLGENRLVQA